MEAELTALAPDLWVAEQPFRFFGIEIGNRMTAVRLPGGKLWLHSPLSPSPGLMDQVRKLGDVAFIVAPSRMHHLSVGLWHDAFPDAQVYVAPGVADKRSDLRTYGVLGENPPEAWADSLDQTVMQGIPVTNEVVFYHRPSHTLIVTDVAMNIGPSSPFVTRLLFWLSASYKKLRPTRVDWVLIRDSDAYRASLERILEWPFDRVIVSHGEVLESGGPEQLRQGHRWLLKK